jgi:DMSO/TMAO reductase YedYZ heme-binding membrane subunit
VTTWIVLRAAGIGAYVMLFLSIAWGLMATTSVLGRRISKASATTVHQFIATCGLVLLGVHLGGLLLDSFMPFTIGDLMIPMAASFRPVAVTFGVLAMYAMVFVIVASWLRRRIGTTWWRRTHLLAVPTFVLSMVHGIFAGTDSVRPAMWWTYVATGLVVLFLVVVRGLTAGYRPPRASSPDERGASPRRPRAVADLPAPPATEPSAA